MEPNKQGKLVKKKKYIEFNIPELVKYWRFKEQNKITKQRKTQRDKIENGQISKGNVDQDMFQTKSIVFQFLEFISECLTMTTGIKPSNIK